MNINNSVLGKNILNNNFIGADGLFKSNHTVNNFKHFNWFNVEGWNLYLLVDSANEKKKTSDYTVMVVIGLGPDNNYYLLDGIRDRLNLTERTEKLFEFHRKWPQIKNHVGWEKYGKDSDIQHIQYVMEEKNYRFGIIELV